MQTLEREIAHFFWHGKLSTFEETCIKSFVDNGFNVNLWSYTNLHVNGVTSRDAKEILPETDLIKYKTLEENVEGKTVSHANIAVFADVFRINLLCKEPGWWADSDCYCLKSSDEFRLLRNNISYVISQEYFHINIFGNSIFYLSKEIASIFKQELDIKLKEYNNTAKTFTDFGPALMSEVSIKYKLFDGLLPSHTFFPIYWKNRHWLVEPEYANKAKPEIKNAYAVHIWCSTLNELGYDKEKPPKGSIIHSLFNKLNISINKDSDQVKDTITFHNRFISVNKLYNDLLKRSADISGLKNYVHSNMSLDEIKKAIVCSDEYKKNNENINNRF
jgi:hypothetical protein